MTTARPADPQPPAGPRWCMACRSPLPPLDEADWVDGRATVVCPQCGHGHDFQRAVRES